MAEVNAAEVEAKADAAFAAGYGVVPPAETPPAMAVEDPKVEPKPAAVVPPVVPEKPQYVRLTKQEVDLLKTRAGKVDSLESQVAKLTGSMPKAEQIVQQVIEKVQSQTPAGVNVEMSDEDFAEFAVDFPELAKMTRTSLERIFKKANVRGTGAPNGAATIDEGAVTKAVETVLTGREKQALEKAHPTWRDIVGAVNMSAGEKPPEANPFRQWLAAQPADYQEEINNTSSPDAVRGAIERFIEHQKTVTQPTPGTPPKVDKAAARRAIIEDAVTPRADGSPPPANAPLSAEDAFAASFKSAKRH